METVRNVSLQGLPCHACERSLEVCGNDCNNIQEFKMVADQKRALEQNELLKVLMTEDMNDGY